MGLRSLSWIDFGADYRLENKVVFAFQGFYFDLGRRELESYGAGLDFRMEF